MDGSQPFLFLPGNAGSAKRTAMIGMSISKEPVPTRLPAPLLSSTMRNGYRRPRGGRSRFSLRAASASLDLSVCCSERSASSTLSRDNCGADCVAEDVVEQIANLKARGRQRPCSDLPSPMDHRGAAFRLDRAYAKVIPWRAEPVRNRRVDLL